MENITGSQDLPFTEIVLYAYAANCTPYPIHVLLPTGLHKARTGALVPRQGPNQEIIPLPGMYFFDGWRVQPSLKIPDNVHKPRTCLFVSQPGRPLKEQCLPDKHQKRRHETSWQQLLRTKWNVVRAHAAQQYVPSSTSGHW